MFREMRRFKQQVSPEACKTVLSSAKRGVLSVAGDDGYPYGVPVDFWYDAEAGKIYIHCAGEGHKFDAIKKNDKVCFTVMDEGYKKENDWAWNVTSVVTFGRAVLVNDRDTVIPALEKIGAKYYPEDVSFQGEVEKSGPKAWLIVITVEHMTGKLVNES